MLDTYTYLLLVSYSEDNVLKAEEENEEDGLNEAEDLSDQPELDLGPGVFRVKNAEDIQSFVDDNPFIVYSNQIVALAKTSIKVCNAKGCNLDLRINTETIAPAVYLKWVTRIFYDKNVRYYTTNLL